MDIIKDERATTSYGSRQHRLFVTDGRRHYMVSWISFAHDTGRPECMAFRCDSRLNVRNWREVAVSYKDDEGEAISDVRRQLQEL